MKTVIQAFLVNPGRLPNFPRGLAFDTMIQHLFLVGQLQLPPGCNANVSELQKTLRPILKLSLDANNSTRLYHNSKQARTGGNFFLDTKIFEYYYDGLKSFKSLFFLDAKRFLNGFFDGLKQSRSANFELLHV